MMTQPQQNSYTYDPITLAILSKMLSADQNKDTSALLQFLQQIQQQNMLLFLYLIQQQQQNKGNSLSDVIAQLLLKNIDLTNQSNQTYLNLIQQQYQQLLNLQKEMSTKKEQELREELKEALEEMYNQIASIISITQKPESKSEIDKLLESLEKINRLREKIDMLVASSPTLMERYSKEGKIDYGALLLDLLGKGLTQGLEVLKYKYITDLEKLKQPAASQLQQVQTIQNILQNLASVNKDVKKQEIKQEIREEPKISKVEQQVTDIPKEIKEPKKEEIGRIISDEQNKIQEVKSPQEVKSEVKNKKQAPI